ncbi:response regulator transcription factor [Embleya sp. NPDC059259]|uniref:response regulator transcription factor n=1 Tax=unclassified Embleya TaxID=2699296 RepID=UPI0036BC4A2E
MAAVRSVAAGQSLLDPAITTRVLDRARNGPAEEAGPAGLSERERQVLEHIARGLTNCQIAESMGLAEKTVENYVSAVLNKLGLKRRVQAAVYTTELHHHEDEHHQP